MKDQLWTAALLTVVSAMKGKSLELLRQVMEEVTKKEDERAVREFLSTYFPQTRRAYEKYRASRTE